MPLPKHEVYRVEIDYAYFRGILELIEKWKNEFGDKLDQQRWRAIADKLSGSLVMDQLHSDIGIDSAEYRNWGNGRNLPSEEMCAIYLGLLCKKIEDHMRKLDDNRGKLLNPPEPEEKPSERTLPKEQIKHFNLPDGMDAAMEINELEGYSELPERVRNVLKNNNLMTVGQVAHPQEGNCTSWKAFLRRRPNCGWKSITALYFFLLDRDFEPVLEG